jgi:hypothetical protein
MTFYQWLPSYYYKDIRFSKIIIKNDKARILEEDMSEQEIKDALIQLEKK